MKQLLKLVKIWQIFLQNLSTNFTVQFYLGHSVHLCSAQWAVLTMAWMKIRLGLWTLEEWSNWVDLPEVFKMKSGLLNVPLTTYFDLNVDSQTRGHSWKIAKKRSKVDIRQYFCSERVLQRWKKLYQVAVDQRTINGFKRALDKRRRMEMDFFMDYSCPPSPIDHIIFWMTSFRTLVWPHQAKITR